MGAGIAGLRAAIELSEAGRVLVVTKEALGESNTNYAQGGIAVAMGGDEDVSLHLEDTVSAGDGLVNREAARVLVEEGPLRVEELLRWGTSFDRENGKLMLTREGRAQPQSHSACQWRCDRRGDRAVPAGPCARARKHHVAWIGRRPRI